jgi:hypothetical protein
VSARAPRPRSFAGGPRERRFSAGNVRTLPRQFATWADLPPALVARLAADDITSLKQWRALGRKRKAIFGITAAHVRLLDEIAGGAA